MYWNLVHTYSYMYQYSTAVHVCYCTTRVGSYSCTPRVRYILPVQGCPSVSYRSMILHGNVTSTGGYSCTGGATARAYMYYTVLYGRYSSYSLYQVLSAWGGLRYLYWNSHTRCWRRGRVIMWRSIAELVENKEGTQRDTDRTATTCIST